MRNVRNVAIRAVDRGEVSVRWVYWPFHEDGSESYYPGILDVGFQHDNGSYGAVFPLFGLDDPGGVANWWPPARSAKASPAGLYGTRGYLETDGTNLMWIAGNNALHQVLKGASEGCLIISFGLQSDAAPSGSDDGILCYSRNSGYNDNGGYAIRLKQGTRELQLEGWDTGSVQRLNYTTSSGDLHNNNDNQVLVIFDFNNGEVRTWINAQAQVTQAWDFATNPMNGDASIGFGIGGHPQQVSGYNGAPSSWASSVMNAGAGGPTRIRDLFIAKSTKDLSSEFSALAESFNSERFTLPKRVIEILS